MNSPTRHVLWSNLLRATCELQAIPYLFGRLDHSSFGDKAGVRRRRRVRIGSASLNSTTRRARPLCQALWQENVPVKQSARILVILFLAGTTFKAVEPGLPSKTAI